MSRYTTKLTLIRWLALNTNLKLRYKPRQYRLSGVPSRGRHGSLTSGHEGSHEGLHFSGQALMKGYTLLSRLSFAFLAIRVPRQYVRRPRNRQGFTV